VNRTQSFNNRLQPTDMKDWLTSGGATNDELLFFEQWERVGAAVQL